LISFRDMKLITAHKILIATAAVFFVFFAFWELRQYSGNGDTWAVVRAVLYFLAGIGFGIYFKNIQRLYSQRR